jgi:carboxypeptidase Taq
MSLMSTVHELGHGLYENQLPSEHVGTPLNQANGMDMHESQSRLWEVCLATSPEFFRWVHQWFTLNAPEYIKGWSAQDLFLLASVVKPSLIRTESDPVTYGMHVMIRFELEMAIFKGTLSVAQLPAAWNEAYQKYLGITPADDSVGILQDSHWSSGAFGYFPSYLLGTMISCQLHAKLQERFPDLSTRVEKGNLLEVRDWLKANVHRFGRGMSAPLIIKQATGKELSPAPFLKFLQERFIE